MTALQHRPDCDCEECWSVLYSMPPILVAGESFAGLAAVARFPITEHYRGYPVIPGVSTHSVCGGCGAPTKLGVHDCGQCPL